MSNNKFYINDKNGDLYEVLNTDFKNATNGSEDQIMVAYTDGNGGFYVREYREFENKFTPLGLLDRSHYETIIKDMGTDTIAIRLSNFLKVNPSLSKMSIIHHFDEFDLRRIRDMVDDNDIAIHIDAYMDKINTIEKITSKTYVEKAIRTESNNMDDITGRITNHQFIRLLHAGMGLTTEIGEFVDALKRHLFYGEELNLSNIKEESGDLMWYIAILIHALKSELDDIMTINIEKLKARYPNKFNKKDALIRDLVNELEAMKQ